MKSVAVTNKKKVERLVDFVVNSVPLVFQFDFLRQRPFKILKTVHYLVTRRFVCYHKRPENT